MSERDRDMLGDDFFDEDDEDAQKDKFLTFRIGAENYGISISHVTEIVVMQQITEVPDMPAFIRGVINLRGQVIPVMDVRSRFKMARRDYDERTCVVVVSINETSVGLIVDRVNEVMDIPAEAIFPPPSIAKGGGSRYVSGMGKVGEDVKILLDVTRLLFEEELSQLENLEQESVES